MAAQWSRPGVKENLSVALPPCEETNLQRSPEIETPVVSAARVDGTRRIRCRQMTPIDERHSRNSVAEGAMNWEIDTSRDGSIYLLVQGIDSSGYG